jgi:uncharacterized membrane protein
MNRVRIRFAYKQGFRRLWLVATAIWLAFVLTVTIMDKKGIADVLLYGVSPAIGLYVLGAALVWIIEGFAKPE